MRLYEPSMMKLVKSYAADDLGNETTKHQFESLWIAFCIEQVLDVDTYTYDTYLTELWDIVESNNTNPYNDFDEFDNEMSKYLC